MDTGLVLSVAIVLACMLALVSGNQSGAPSSQRDDYRRLVDEYLDKLKKRDSCGALYTSESRGYQMREYELTLADNYQITLHRLVHPEDRSTSGTGDKEFEDKVRHKKPYLLVHGLIGTSASFVVNVDDKYQAPARTYKARDEIVGRLKSRANIFQHEWESTATRLQRLNEQEEAKTWSKKRELFADQNDIIYDGDQLNFGPQYRQAYNKFDLPQKALGHTANSLAFTLSNFGYDVWLINMRGNEYSKGFNGHWTRSWDEYWNFDIDTLVREDLMAAINKIQSVKGVNDPIGLVTYSYSAAHIMNLLTKFPAYAHRVQPIVMLAPTLLTGAHDRKQKSRYVLKLINKLLSRNGPFPSASFAGKSRQWKSVLSLGKLDERLAHLACKLPIASQLCRFMENMLHGDSQRVSTVKGLILAIGPDKRALSLRQRDNDCGRTSKTILHQIFKNIDQENIPAQFMAFASVKQRQLQTRAKAAGAGPSEGPARRSVILIHAQDDEMATMAEVQRIRSTALKTLTLLDYVIKVPNFSHSDFLFSRQNQFLVNAEVIRQVLLFDFLAYQSYANEATPVPLGIRPA